MKNTLKFTYQLSYDEIYEAFSLLSLKWSKKARFLLTIVLTTIAACFLSLYAFNGKRIYYFFLAIVDIFLLYYLIYVPILKAKRGAQNVCRQHGTYKVELTDTGHIISEHERLALAGDAGARAIETKTSYIIRPDKQHTFCIPKRIMTLKEQNEVEKILSAACKYQKEL